MRILAFFLTLGVLNACKKEGSASAGPPSELHYTYSKKITRHIQTLEEYGNPLVMDIILKHGKTAFYFTATHNPTVIKKKTITWRGYLIHKVNSF